MKTIDPGIAADLWQEVENFKMGARAEAANSTPDGQINPIRHHKGKVFQACAEHLEEIMNRHGIPRAPQSAS
jgi:hypothetical protein